MKLITNEEQEYIPSIEKLSMGELYDLATDFGDVEIGGMLSPKQVTIKCNFVGMDYVSLKEVNGKSVEVNLSYVIDRARKLKLFYESIK